MLCISIKFIAVYFYSNQVLWNLLLQNTSPREYLTKYSPLKNHSYWRYKRATLYMNWKSVLTTSSFFFFEQLRSPYTFNFASIPYRTSTPLTANIRLRWTHKLTWVGNKGSREICLWLSQSLSLFSWLLQTKLVLLVQLKHLLASLHFNNHLTFYLWLYLLKNFILCVSYENIRQVIRRVRCGCEESHEHQRGPQAEWEEKL